MSVERFDQKVEEARMQSPFQQREKVVLPIVLKPLRYCEFRTFDASEYGGSSNVDVCAVFASGELEGMSFCHQHGQVIALALEGEEDVG